MAIAVQPILGYNYGAKLWSRVRETFRTGVVGATATATVMWALLMVFAREIVVFFGIDSPELVDFTVRALRINLVLLPFIGFQIMGSNYFQATGQPAKSIVLSLSRQILFLVPAQVGLPLVLPLVFDGMTPLRSIFFSWPLSDFLAVFAVGIFVIVEMRRLNRRISAQEQEA